MSEFEPETPDESIPEPEEPETSPEQAQPDTPETPDPAGWQDSPEFQQAVQQAAGSYLEQLLASQPADEQPQEQVELDPFADDYPQRLQQLVAHTVQEIVGSQLAPLAPIVEQQQLAQAEQWANGLLDQLGIDDDGTLDTDTGIDSRGAVLRASAGFIAYGPDGQPHTAPQDAIRQAAEYINQRDQRVAARAVEQYKATLRGDHGGGFTPYEPAGGFSAAQAADEPSSYDDVVNRVLSQTGA